MNVAINFRSDDYRLYVEQLVDSIYEDTEASYDDTRLLQDITHNLFTRFYDYVIPNNITREDLLNDEDPVIVLLVRMMIHIEKIYPTATPIGFFPVNLSGRMLVVLHIPDIMGFDLTAITHL